MVDFSDPNLGYLIAGILTFWLPVLGYIFLLRSRQQRLEEEALLLQEELGQ